MIPLLYYIFCICWDVRIFLMSHIYGLNACATITIITFNSII